MEALVCNRQGDTIAPLMPAHLLLVGNHQTTEPLIHEDARKDPSFQFAFANQPHEVWSFLDTQQIPDQKSAIIMDARWADEDRLRLLQQLQQHPNYAYVPVLVISDRIHWALGQKYLEKGADDYFNSPIDAQRLSTLLEYLWENKPAILEATQEISIAQNEVKDYRAQHFKRAFDIFGASVALVVFSPIMLLTALAIRLESKGPIFYCSKRVGAGFKTFNFWKFRSMYADADQRLKEMSALNQYGQNATFVKIVNDPRITKVGRFIRKYSIDELPQLYNVLVGDMSLVGNRPLPLYEADKLFVEQYSPRFLAPAGLTGLWQVSKRGSSDMSTHERIHLDIQYVRQQSLLMDLRIMFRTLTAFVQKENV